MNSPIRRVAVVAMVMFAALMLNLSVASVVRQESLTNHPSNRRVADARFAQDRGPILVGKSAIAETDPVKDRFKFQRSYPSGELYAPITGYYSYLFRASALEAAYSSELSGSDDSQFLERIINQAVGSTPRGATLETTVDARAQRAAWQGLQGRKGAVVALDTETGAVLALVTSPSYDPNDLATHDLGTSQKAWERLSDDPDRPMSNRASKEIYPPGSTFKLIVAAAALEDGMSADSTIEAPSSYKLPGSTVTIDGNCGGSEITLTQALRVSCNPGFAKLGVDLGADALRAQAEKFGFGMRYLTDVGQAASRFPSDPDPAQTAMSSIGAFEVAATPLQMAMVAAAADNDGIVMEPYIVDRILTADLQVLSKTRPQQLSVALTPGNAAELRTMMRAVVTSGTGWRANIPGLDVGGKTGTAKVDAKRLPYAWFVAYARELDVAVAVFIEDAEIPATDVAGGLVAAPVARAVIEALQ